MNWLMDHKLAPSLTLLATLVSVIALVSSCAAEPVPVPDVDTVTIDLRAWQNPDQPDALEVRADVVGAPGESLNRVPLALDRRSTGYSEASKHWFGELFLAGVGLRIFQQEVAPERIFVSACAAECVTRSRTSIADHSAYSPFRPLGKTQLQLEDGQPDSGGERYADLRIVVPRENPGLLRDREHLLALRDVFDADPPLDWSVSTPATTWEGVALSGTPPRVTKLDLSDRNLRGELWGYIGDLTELRELRLDKNELSGIVPTKMQLLKQLQELRLRGNSLEGCAPPVLWSAERHDLSRTELSVCPDLVQDQMDSVYAVFYIAWRDDGLTYGDIVPVFLVIDVLRKELLIKGRGPEPAMKGHNGEVTRNAFQALENGYIMGNGARNREDPFTYVFWDWDTGRERERNPYHGCVYDCRGAYSSAAWAEKIAASTWLVPVHYDEQTGQRIWIWP